MSLAIVAQNIECEIIMSRRRRVPFIQEPEIAERMAAYHAIRQASHLQLRGIVIEGDYLSVIHALQ